MRELYMRFELSSIGSNAVESKIRARWRKDCLLRPGSNFKCQIFNSICELYIYPFGCQASGVMLLVGSKTNLDQTELLIEADCLGSNRNKRAFGRRLAQRWEIGLIRKDGRQRSNRLTQAFTVPGLPFSTTNEARVLIGSSGFVTAARTRKSVCHRLGLTSQRT